MSDRIRIDEEALNDVVGGNITYTWRNGQGTCGLNNENTYTFTDKNAFLNSVKKNYVKGMSDAELLQKLVDDNVIH